jgi:hypothetical protein
MAIAVFIAPILLSWEALSSLPWEWQALPCRLALPHSHIAPEIAVGRLNNERVFLDLEELVAIGRARWNAAEGIARVTVEQCLAVDRPAPLEFGNQFRAKFYLTGK